jgi:hypothetical protein
MCGILYYNSPILNLSSKTQVRKGLIICNTTNGITTLKRHVNSDHCSIYKKIEKKVNCPLRVEDEKQLSKKRPNIFSNSISNFIFGKEPFKKNKCITKTKFERLGSFNCQKPFSFIVCGKYLVEKV